MTTYAQILLVAIPIFIGLIIIEYLFSLYQRKEVFNSFDTISSLSSGMTNILKDTLHLSIIIVSYSWLYDHFAVVKINLTWMHYVIAFFALDLAGYWTHRLEHEINFLWNRHIIHHSSEEYNLACALRQNVSAIVSWFIVFLLPAAFLGVPPQVINILAPIHLFAQFWYHTKLINKMGFLEYIIVTPSHHRVHHAINKEYIDKNYSQIFIFWDKLFGTFQVELKEVPPVYGVKKAVHTWNPILINFQHLWQIFVDAVRTKAWSDKLKIWFMPTGWRPKDVSVTYPISITDDAYAQVKYRTSGSLIFNLFVWIQFLLTFGLMMYLFSHYGDYPFYQLLLTSIFIALMIFAYTSLMDYSYYSMFGLIMGSVLLGYSQYTNRGLLNINMTILWIWLVIFFAFNSIFLMSKIKRDKININ